MTISAAAIDLMVNAGASCAQLAIVARQHFPDVAGTIDALISVDTPVGVIAALIKSQAADCGAAAREEKRKEDANKRQQKCRSKTRAKRAEIVQLNEPELPLLDGVSRLSRDSCDTRDNRAPPP